MKLVYLCIATICCVSLDLARADEALDAPSRKGISEEMQLINKSLESLLSELAAIKREATGRLAQVKRGPAATAAQTNQNDMERIRQQKVSRFVLKRVAELESESLGMRDEMAKLFELSKKAESRLQSRQEDHDFEELAASSTTTTTTTNRLPATTQTAAAPSSTTTSSPTLKPDEQAEADKIGFDLEQLKRLGNELESEIESRQAQNPQSLRGIHEQVVRMTNQMVENYLGHVRRVVHRFNNLFERVSADRRSGQLQPREGSNEGGKVSGESLLGQLEDLSRGFREFALKWSLAVGKQQSPLIDRIPPRGVELWRDFWDTVRRQMRRINNEFLQVTRDMGRLLTGRRPANPDGAVIVVRPREGEQEQPALMANLLYSNQMSNTQQLDPSTSVAAIEKQFKEFYERLSAQLENEQKKMDAIGKASGQSAQAENNNLIEELDDEQTRLVLTQNPGLRQQINQDINVFSSIFDIIRTFLTRLRGSAEDIRNILERPGAMRDNNPVTPGPSVKPTVDQLLKETLDQQRNINSQARPVG